MFTLESLLKTQQDQHEQHQKLKEYFETLPKPKPPSLIPIETSARTRIYNRQPNLPVSTWNIDQGCHNDIITLHYGFFHNVM